MTYLDPNISVENYRYVAEANAKGINLKDAIMKAEQKEHEMNELRKQLEEAKQTGMMGTSAGELFAIQQSLVKDVPEVAAASAILSRIHSEAEAELLYAENQKYRNAYDAYKKAVENAYIQHLKATGQSTK